MVTIQTVLWTVHNATGNVIKCVVTTPDDEDLKRSVRVRLLRDGQIILSEWFENLESALERCNRLRRQLDRYGWRE